MLEYKQFAEFKLLDTDTGGFSGYGSVFGVRDDGGDIVQAGAFADTLPAFLKDGFIGLGHDWNGLAIGTVAEAREDERGLFLRAEYHSTPEAQNARRVAQERMERGKSVGLSIGFQIQPGGHEMAKDGTRHLLKLGLFEVSQVNVPMLRPAGLMDVKGVPFSTELVTAHAAVMSACERAEALVSLRSSEGRKAGAELSAANWKLLADLDAAMGQIEELRPRFKELLARNNRTPDKSSDLMRLRFETERLMARIHHEHGVPA